MTRPQYVVRTGTVEHWAHNVDYPMPQDFTPDREGGMSWFRAMRDMASQDGVYTDGAYKMKLVLVERTPDASGDYKEEELETWVSIPTL